MVANATVARDAILSLVKGWEPKLLRMCVAFNWVGLSWVKIGRKVQSVWGYCHASWCICVFVGVSVRWMKVKGTCGIFTFF